MNRIKTIHSSLAIEQYTLSLEQVSDVINGKRVLAAPKEIQEVKNAYEAYEKLRKLEPYSLEDLLKAHKYMHIQCDAPHLRGDSHAHVQFQ